MSVKYQETTGIVLIHN